MQPAAGPTPATRQALLRELLHRKAGMTVGELSAAVGVSRSAVQQHMSLLEREGLVESGLARSRAGRPRRLFRLSDAGYERFPRRYDLLSVRALLALQGMLGEEALDRLFEGIAGDLAREMGPSTQAPTARQRLEAVIARMNDLGYEARTAEGGCAIEAVNCIYHHIARQTRAVCRFDVRLISRLLGSAVEHVASMADGADRCLFRVGPAPDS